MQCAYRGTTQTPPPVNNKNQIPYFSLDHPFDFVHRLNPLLIACDHQKQAGSKRPNRGCGTCKSGGHLFRYGNADANTASKLAEHNKRPGIMMCSKPCRYLFTDLICYSSSDLLIAAFSVHSGFVIVAVLWLFVWTNYG